MKLLKCTLQTLALALALLPAVAAAQSAATGAIAGVARDTTGAVLPGVTVEASSPALIEKVRAAVTDGQGNYKIVDLRPGTYTVTFTLPGFGAFRREGIELTSGVTANINGELKVGGLEETVTVTGASPTVDIQNVRTQTVLSRDVLDSLPFARSTAGIGQITLGVSMGASDERDVGGVREANSALTVHGSRNTDSQFRIDGLSFQNNSGDGGGRMKTYFANPLAMQETALETGGMSADANTGGVQVNYVLKDGGNQFDFYGTTTFANGSMQSTNLTDDVISRGITTASALDRMYDAGVGVGGPIMRDKVWFYTAHRWWGSREFQPGVYFNKSTNYLFYEPDLTRQGYIDNYFRDHSGRVTWQATTKHKLAAYQSYQSNCFCISRVNSSLSPEATYSLRYKPMLFTIGSWTNPASNRLLFDGALAYHYQPKKTLNLSQSPDAVQIQDTGFGITYGAFASTTSVAYNTTELGQLDTQYNGKLAMSYVTGSHALKVGFQFFRGWQNIDRTIQNHITYTFNRGTPISLQQWATPILTQDEIFWTGLYAQDQWTISRLTLTGGVRFDAFRGWADEVTLAASRFRPAATFPAINDSPNWKDITPRLGAAYDVFGNGKTAIKASLNKYVQSMGAGLTETINPQLSMSARASRSWNDANRNYQPDCNLNSTLANGECGGLDNRNFGTVVQTRRFDDAYIRGFGARPYNWQSSLVFQQELGPGIGASVGYFRTWFGNFSVTDNLLVTPADYTQYCVTLPTDARLPGSGQRQCGLYDINPAKFGQVDNLVTRAEGYGDFSNVFDGIDGSVTSRFGRGAMFTAGFSIGRTVTDNCVVVDSPQDAREGYCKTTTPWWNGGGQVKLNGVYPLPWWGVRVSGTFQNVAATQVLANNTYRSADVIASLGRNLSSSTVSVPILPEGTLYEKRLNQVDVRLTKILRMGRTNLETSFDVYNLTNSGAILAVNNTYGTRWRQPTTLIPGRLIKVGAVARF